MSKVFKSRAEDGKKEINERRRIALDEIRYKSKIIFLLLASFVGCHRTECVQKDLCVGICRFCLMTYVSVCRSIPPSLSSMISSAILAAVAFHTSSNLNGGRTK